MFTFTFDVRYRFKDKDGVFHFLDELKEGEYEYTEEYGIPLGPFVLCDIKSPNDKIKLQTESTIINNLIHTVITSDTPWDNIIWFDIWDDYNRTPCTLLDLVKNRINGQLSDGIGEAPIPVKYKGNWEDAWTNEIISEEPLNKCKTEFIVNKTVLNKDCSKLLHLQQEYKLAEENLFNSAGISVISYYLNKLEKEFGLIVNKTQFKNLGTYKGVDWDYDCRSESLEMYIIFNLNEKQYEKSLSGFLKDWKANKQFII